jgi:hypothetical protein
MIVSEDVVKIKKQMIVLRKKNAQLEKTVKMLR